jgi:hypothetical protein
MRLVSSHWSSSWLPRGSLAKSMSSRVGARPSTFDAGFLVAIAASKNYCGCGMKSTWTGGHVELLRECSSGLSGIKPSRLAITSAQCVGVFRPRRIRMPAVTRFCILFTTLTSLSMLLLPGLITTFIEIQQR